MSIFVTPSSSPGNHPKNNRATNSLNPLIFPPTDPYRGRLSGNPISTINSQAIESCSTRPMPTTGNTVASNQNGKQDNGSYNQVHVDLVATELLQAGQLIWSQSPRLYIILQKIGSLSLFDRFNEEGISDLWLPIISESMLEVLIPNDMRHPFVQAQRLVCGQPVDFHLGYASSHGHFAPESHPPFQSRRHIGYGSLGSVDEVLSLTDGQIYARKSIRRTSCVSINKSRVQAFQRELYALNRIRHRHCVKIVGSYTTSRDLAIVMSPLADSDLSGYLVHAGDSPEPNVLFPVRHWFGCLATAVRYLHLNRIRHRDIKPGNILVHNRQVLLVDFGLAWDWKDAKSSTTSSYCGFTRPYAAPEVIVSKKRDSSSDIWSLGCVFFEMATVLKRKRVLELRDFFIKRSDSYHFYNNEFGITAWVNDMTSLSNIDNAPFFWASKMLQMNRKERPSAATLVSLINDRIPASGPGTVYVGRCCQPPSQNLIRTSACGRCGQPVESNEFLRAALCTQCKHIYSSQYLSHGLIFSPGSWPVPCIVSSFFPSFLIQHLTNTYLNGFTDSIVSNGQWESQDMAVKLSCIPKLPLALTLRRFLPACDLMSLQRDPGTTIDFRSPLPLGLHDIDSQAMAEHLNIYLDDIVDNHLTAECLSFLLQFRTGDHSSRVLYRLFTWFHDHKHHMPNREVVMMRSAIKLIAIYRIIMQALLLDDIPQSFRAGPFGDQTGPQPYSDRQRQSPLLLSLQVKVAFHNLQCSILKQVLTGLKELLGLPKAWASCLFISMCLAFLIERIDIASIERLQLSLRSPKGEEHEADMFRNVEDYSRSVEDMVFCRIYRPMSANMRSRRAGRTSTGSVLVHILGDLRDLLDLENAQNAATGPQHSSRLVLSLLDLVDHM
ncbi:kinase-like protein [Cadophora sp. DSE1049]|nr:kinase-like protein [Cadophora sp. DSE1049]